MSVGFIPELHPQMQQRKFNCASLSPSELVIQNDAADVGKKQQVNKLREWMGHIAMGKQPHVQPLRCGGKDKHPRVDPDAQQEAVLREWVPFKAVFVGVYACCPAQPQALQEKHLN